MTHLLPSNLLRLFAPRPAIPYVKPIGRDPGIPLNKVLGGVGSILEELREETALKDAEEDEIQRKAGTSAGKTTSKDKDGPAIQVDGEGEGEDGDKENKPSIVKSAEETGEVEEGEALEAVEDADSKKQMKPKGIAGPAGDRDDDVEAGFTHSEAERYRLRVIERKRKREEGLKDGLDTCTNFNSPPT